jgi:hypothetical protein
MKSTEATVFDRKSEGAGGPVVRAGSRTKVSVPLVLPQTLSARTLHGSSFPLPPHLFLLEEWRLQVLRIAKIA